MAGTAYVNGRYLPLRHARVNIEDRGYQFGDGIYEVFYAYRGRLVDEALHLARLARSLKEIELPEPLSGNALSVVIREVLRRNRIATGLVYLQVTRGVAKRAHPFPAIARPSLVITARHGAEPPERAEDWAASAITLPDARWGRCDIKSINLLPNVLAREEAKRAGAYEAILYDSGGNITEGAASSVWIVDASGTLRTRALGTQILPGCTRAALLDEIANEKIPAAQNHFSRDELRAAREIFLTSATSFVKPITMLDGAPVATGQPGPVTKLLFARYIRHIKES